MPLIHIRYHKQVDKGTVLGVRDSLFRLVAENLSCSDPGGKLVAKDIEAHVDVQGDMDLTVYDLDIKIDANFFPSRNADLSVRTRRIMEGLEAEMDEELSGLNYSLWVFLGHAAFEESKRACEEPTGLLAS